MIETCMRFKEIWLPFHHRHLPIRAMCPSVDRASLCGNNPCYSQKDEKDAVVSLITKDVRLIDSVIQNNPKGEPEFTYKIDVLARATEENPAHAQIEPSPEYRNKTPFRKLLERLAYLANQREWEIEPLRIAATERVIAEIAV